MPRTTEELVEGVLVSFNEEIDLAPFIEAASALVSDVCQPAGLPEERLELVERWLAAHFYACVDPRVTQEKADTVGVTYEGSTSGSAGTGLLFTRFGQQALRLDRTGALAAFDRACRVGGSSVTAIYGPKPAGG